MLILIVIVIMIIMISNGVSTNGVTAKPSDV